MPATRRLEKELEYLRSSDLKSFKEIQVDEANPLVWYGLIFPETPPYGKGAFLIEINFPAEYPFRPPEIRFKTKINHPLINEKGKVFLLPIIRSEDWRPGTKMVEVIQALIALVNHPFAAEESQFARKRSERRTNK